KRKIMSAFSGGQASIEEHRRLGGNPHVDMAFLYLKSYFLTKKESEDVSERYSSGAMLSGEMKNMLFEKVIERINKLKEAYEKSHREGYRKIRNGRRAHRPEKAHGRI
ncbi:Tryptophanyl-tRNA synthetase, partial [mine drainage metagenome]